MQKNAQSTHNYAEKTVRLDKWLWAARFYKTRTLAKAMIDGGKVQYNGNRAKVSKNVEIGAFIKLRQGNEEKEVQVLLLEAIRRGATDAQRLYRETDESLKKRELLALARKNHALAMPNPERRPTKKERRELLAFKAREQQEDWQND